jgi:uncharacterized protein (DUF1697 family)
LKKLIAFFRGMNVGGNRITMQELVTLLEGLGCRNVRTYIQSGNAVFESQNEDVAKLAQRINFAIKACCSFDPAVVLLHPDGLRQVINNNPFPDFTGNPKSIHLGFMERKPENPDLDLLAALRSGSEQFHLVGSVFYLLAPDGVGRSKLAANAERLLGLPMTDRNWRTVCAVMVIAEKHS